MNTLGGLMGIVRADQHLGELTVFRKSIDIVINQLL